MSIKKRSLRIVQRALTVFVVLGLFLNTDVSAPTAYAAGAQWVDTTDYSRRV